MSVDPFDPLRGSASFQLQSDLERMTEGYRRLHEVALGPTGALENALIGMNSFSEAVRRATEPAYRISLAMQESFDRLQISKLYEPGGALSRLDEQMSALSQAVNRATAPYENVATAMAQAMDRLTLPYENMAAAVARMQPAMETGIRLAEAITRISETWRTDYAGLDGVGITSRLLSQAVAAQAIVQQQRTSSAVQSESLLLDGIRVIEDELGQAATPEGIRSALEKLLDIFSLRLAKAKSVLEEQALGNIISLLALLLAFYALVDANSGQQELLDAVRSGPAQISASIEELQHAHHAETTATLDELEARQAIVGLISRPAIVRAAPHVSAIILERLPADEVVEFVETQAGWAHVRFYDAINDVVVDGWVYGKLVRVLPRPAN